MSLILSKKRREGWTPLARVTGGVHHKKYISVSRNNDPDGKKEIIISDGRVDPILSQWGIRRCLMVGPTLSGKSTLIGRMLSHAKSPALVFSEVEEDPVLAGKAKKGMTWVDLDELAEEPQHISEFAGNILIFDDIDSLEDQNLVKYLNRLNDAALRTGRHHDIPATLRTNDVLYEGPKTKRHIIHDNFIVLFKNGNALHTERFLKTAMGRKPAQIEEILSLPGDWIGCYKNAPQAIITDDRVSLNQRTPLIKH